MMFRAIPALTLTLIAAVCVQAGAIPDAIIPVGGRCSGITGPIGTCTYGSICCAVIPDLSVCAAVAKCPKKFLKEGELCSGFTGPSPYPCIPGTQCCNLGPDRSVCRATCGA